MSVPTASLISRDIIDDDLRTTAKRLVSAFKATGLKPGEVLEAVTADNCKSLHINVISPQTGKRTIIQLESMGLPESGSSAVRYFTTAVTEAYNADPDLEHLFGQDNQPFDQAPQYLHIISLENIAFKVATTLHAKPQPS